MLSPPTIHRISLPYAPLVLLLLAWGLMGAPAVAQRNVAALAMTTPERDPVVRVPAVAAADVPTAQSFTFERSLIRFEAVVNGSRGQYLLDTGAPSLIVNTRCDGAGTAGPEGYGTGGAVQLTEHRIDRFEMGERSVENYWAIGLDLREFEARTQQRVDGLVGYDLLNEGELRIDFRRKHFRLLPSVRRPRHDGAPPRQNLRFSLLGHLPLVGLRIDGKLHYFIIDTGAGANLIDRGLLAEPSVSATGRACNIQGLDGAAADHGVAEVAGQPLLDGVSLVAMDLQYLQSDPAIRIAGVLGSPFLSRYTVGIDYRRRRLRLW